jgi:hypothetical protein
MSHLVITHPPFLLYTACLCSESQTLPVATSLIGGQLEETKVRAGERGLAFPMPVFPLTNPPRLSSSALTLTGPLLTMEETQAP